MFLSVANRDDGDVELQILCQTESKLYMHGLAWRYENGTKKWVPMQSSLPRRLQWELPDRTEGAQPIAWGAMKNESGVVDGVFCLFF